MKYAVLTIGILMKICFGSSRAQEDQYKQKGCRKELACDWHM